MKLIIYKAADGWRWRIKGRNGRIVADGGEAYKSLSGIKRAVGNLPLVNCQIEVVK
jgi:uncharacterized protein YegP (UPF0339 family)